MVRLLVLFISALAFVSVSAQTIGADAQYVLNTIAALQANATNLQIKTQSLNSASCPQYGLTRTGPVAEIIPILNGIKAGLLVANPATFVLTPLSDTVCTSANFAIAQSIAENLGGVTISLVRAFVKLSGKGQLNACGVLPAVGQAIRTPLEELEVVLLPYYIAVLIFAPSQDNVVGQQYDVVQGLIDLAISAYKPVIGIP